MKRIAFLCMLFVLGAHLLSEVCAQGTEKYGTYDEESETFTIKKEFLGKKIPMRAIADACEITDTLYGDYDAKSKTQFGGAGKDRDGSQYFENEYIVHNSMLRDAKVVCDSGVPLMLDLTAVEDTAFKATLCFLGTRLEGQQGYVPNRTQKKEVSLAVDTTPGGNGAGAGGKPTGNQGEKPESPDVPAWVNTLLLLILLILQFVRKDKNRSPKAQQVPSPTAANMPQPQPIVSSNRNPEYQQLLVELGALKQRVETLQQGIQQLHVQQQQHVQPLPPTPPSAPTPRNNSLYEPEEEFDKVRYNPENHCLLSSTQASNVIRVIKKGNDIRFTLKDTARQGILSNLPAYVGCIEIAGNTVTPTRIDKITPGKLRQEGNCYVVVEPIILHYL